jgi:hypothetical protein
MTLLGGYACSIVVEVIADTDVEDPANESQPQCQEL